MMKLPQFRHWRLWLVSAALMLPNTLSATCYGTAHSAIAALTASPLVGETPGQTGYRVARIKADQVLGLQWVTISSCSHPEWPSLVLSLPAGSSVQPRNAESSIRSVEPSPIVHVGDVVRLWKNEGVSRIEVVGVSEESGGVGKKVRVRLLHRNYDEEAAPRVLSGVIRGPSNVEMQ